MSAPIHSGRVLPTLNADGTRRRIRPRLHTGRTWRARRLVAWALMIAFVAIPWLRIGGKPVMLLDLARREFTFFGATFLATDGVVLMLLLLTIFFGIVLSTALIGRAWCGWACPQTVYLEFLYRPIERLFEGRREDQLRMDRDGGGLRRAAKNGVFLVISILLGNAFLAYFVGTERLIAWVRRSPLEHPESFLVMSAVSLLVFVDFAWFREQMCTIACPYARLQSVLVDPRSLVVGYDVQRGEPRSKGRPRPGSGDCIDCSACVTACPTGIDIRQGLQLECVACAQCIDACDSIMHRLKKPPGLIRYGAQESLESGRPSRVLRPRVIVYAAIFCVLVSALAVAAGGRESADVIVLRGLGAPFDIRDGLAVNQIRIKVQNRLDRPSDYRIELLDAPEARLIAPENPLRLAPRAQRATSVFVMIPPAALSGGQRAVRFRVSDQRGFQKVLPYKLLGPQGAIR